MRNVSCLLQKRARDGVNSVLQGLRPEIRIQKKPWAASTLSQGYKNERGSRQVPSQSFDLTSYNMIISSRSRWPGNVPPRTSIRGRTRGQKPGASRQIQMYYRGLCYWKTKTDTVPVPRARQRLLLDENQPRCLEGDLPLPFFNEGPKYSRCRYVMAHTADILFFSFSF